MLNPFPDLLSLSFFAPTLLRIAAGLMFAYVGYTQLSRRTELSAVRFPIVGSGVWIVWLSALALFLIALGLTLGLYTQIASLFGALGSVKFLVWSRQYPSMVVLSRPASALLFVICLSLLLTGAGMFAFDIPL